MKICFIARNDGTDGRQAKICNSLIRLGHDVTYIGWDRQPGRRLKIPLDPRVRRYVFEWGAGWGEMSLNGWPQFFGYVAKALSAIRPDAVHARDEQIAAFVLPLKGLLYRYLVLDIFDSLLARSWSNPALAAAGWATRHAAQIGSDRIIETSETLQRRLGRRAARSAVIMNVPPDPGDGPSRNYPTGEAVRIAVGGSLGREREGLDTLLRAVEMLPPGAVKILASGWLHDDFAKQVFVKHPAVEYRWLDSQEEFRDRAGSADALTYLCSNISGTSYRAQVMPHRIFDAMSVGRPLIVSNRLELSRWVERDNLGYVVDPEDAAGLAAIFRKLQAARPALPDFSRRVRAIFAADYTWARMEQRLGELYDGLEAAAPVPVGR